MTFNSTHSNGGLAERLVDMASVVDAPKLKLEVRNPNFVAGRNARLTRIRAAFWTEKVKQFGEETILKWIRFGKKGSKNGEILAKYTKDDLVRLMAGDLTVPGGCEANSRVSFQADYRQPTGKHAAKYRQQITKFINKRAEKKVAEKKVAEKKVAGKKVAGKKMEVGKKMVVGKKEVPANNLTNMLHNTILATISKTSLKASAISTKCGLPVAMVELVLEGLAKEKDEKTGLFRVERVMNGRWGVPVAKVKTPSKKGVAKSVLVDAKDFVEIGNRLSAIESMLNKLVTSLLVESDKKSK